KWSCKLCGEKQSLLKEYGRGSGADCRRHVQKLNAMRGAMMEDLLKWFSNSLEGVPRGTEHLLLASPSLRGTVSPLQQR
uniref:MRN complex-interacting protein N-terminal domain-containing protein n=1 Tax=Acanthochromis polyacanthus TaxID=80966 RepID=A0A3Q1EWG0_9TELE